MVTDDAAGVLLGLACGDALGRPVEFRSANRIAAEHGTLTEMRGNGTWNQPPGTVTDDTDQALCLARSLAEREQFDPADVAERFVAWYDSNPFDIGIMTQKSLRRLRDGEPWDEAGQRVWEASTEGKNAGNGSVMRCAPLAIVALDEPARLTELSRQSSQITHADPRCTAGCAVLNLTIAGYLTGAETPLSTALARLDDAMPEELHDALAPVAAGDRPDTLETTGYVVHTLQTALWDATQADAVEDAIVTTVNRGGDTDTIGAVTGAVAGARFGAAALPDRWLDTLDVREELVTLAEDLATVSEGSA